MNRSNHLLRTSLAISSLVAALALDARADVYTDATGEVISGAPNLDITSVQVVNDATTLSFTLSLAGSIGAGNDWGNYMIGLKTGPGGDTGGVGNIGNPWNRPIKMSEGMNYWFGSWVNGGGGVQLWKFTTPAWNQLGSPGLGLGASSLTLSTPLADLGLAPGNSFQFDVYASGALGDPGAIDAAGNPLQTIGDWGNPYDSGNRLLSYTVVVVPEPGTAALLGLGLACAMFLRRRQ